MRALWNFVFFQIKYYGSFFSPPAHYLIIANEAEQKVVFFLFMEYLQRNVLHLTSLFQAFV